jgi:ribokinase
MRRDEGLLTVIGAINWDISVFEERFARPGEEVPVRQVEEFSGGKGANVAVASARVLGKGRVAFVGALGEDEEASRQVSALRDEGVLTDGLIEARGARSGRAYIIVDSNGRKTIHTHFGANESITPRDLSFEGVSRVLDRTRMMIVMDPPTRVALAIARRTKGKGAKVVYSPGVRSRDGIRSIAEMLRFSDYVALDSHEVRNLFPAKDAVSAVERFKRAHPKLTLVTTLGPRGCIVAVEGVTSTIQGVELSLLGKRAVNSTGSGDAFLGVFASYLLTGHSPLESANWANLAGALKATRYETRGSPTRVELESAMSRLKKVRRSRRD